MSRNRSKQKRQNVQALDDVSLEVAEGEFIVSSAEWVWKSTLLDIIAGLEKTGPRQVLGTVNLCWRRGGIGWSCSGSALFPCSMRSAT